MPGFNGTSFQETAVADRQPVACVVCEAEFLPKSGVHKFCSEDCKGKWKYITGKESTDNQYKKISGNWSRYLARLIYAGGKKRAALSVPMLLEILEEQDYRCALSGVELTCLLEKGKKFSTNVSVDRVDAGGPYIRDNIQLVCIAVNKWRGDTPLDEFIWFCKKITEYQE